MGLETFEAIAQQLDETRMLMFGQSFDLPADKVILDYFENLAVYVITNFELPYISKSLLCNYLQVENFDNTLKIIESLKHKHQSLTHQFNLEKPLLAIGECFKNGKARHLSIDEITRINYLIAKLHTEIAMVVYS